jgi:hypothetical protein
MDPKRDFVEPGAELKTLTNYTHKQVEAFGAFLKEVDESVKDPRKSVEEQTQFVENRISKNIAHKVHALNASKTEMLEYINSYRENAYSRLLTCQQLNRPLDKLMARCREKYNEWIQYYHDNQHDYDERFLKPILLELVDLKRHVYESTEEAVFSSQRLFAHEKKFNRHIDWTPSVADDFFYLDLNRIKNVKQPKVVQFPNGNTTNCHVFPLYGSRIIATWCEDGMARLQLLEFDENSEQMHVLNTVTNSESEDVLVAGAHKDNMIALAFTYDNNTYWIKAYSPKLKELGILRLSYAPITLNVDENFLYVMATQTPLMRVYNTKLEELKTFSSDINSDLYYLLRYGTNIQFKNDFIFMINENKHLDVILRVNDQVIKTLDIPNMKSFVVDSLLRIIVLSEEPPRFTIYDLNNNVIQVLEAKQHISSFCTTDNGFLVATNGHDGEISLY